ncbi:MAG: TadE/TadG family type IV pilus assembly protein [Actinomycetota bacterium]
MAAVPIADSRRGERRRERGAALVEMAIVAGPLLVIMLGIIEVGLLWRESLVLHEATRSGARVAASMVDEPASDREALRALVSYLDADDLAEIEYVVIYRHDGTGTLPAGCEASSQANCNHYPAAALGDLDDDSRWECVGAAYDGAWCPTTRAAELHSPIDIGIRIVSNEPPLTGFFPATVDVTAETVMRLNPLTR